MESNKNSAQLEGTYIYVCVHERNGLYRQSGSREGVFVFDIICYITFLVKAGPGRLRYVPVAERHFDIFSP